MNDVRVIERGARARFPIETFQGNGIAFQLLAHEFHGDESGENRVERSINLSVAAGSYLALQLELPDLHRHHDRVAAFFAWLGCQRREVTWNEDFGLTGRVAAGDQF